MCSQERANKLPGSAWVAAEAGSDGLLVVSSVSHSQILDTECKFSAAQLTV